MKLLVTGGAGYIGSHFSLAAVQAGHDVTVLDDLSRGNVAAVYASGVTKFVRLNLNVNNQKKLVDLFDASKFDAVVHFAAYAYVEESERSPLLYYENNCVGTLALLHAMRLCNLDKIVFSSSCATYGQPMIGGPIDEMHPQFPLSPYGTSKLLCEKMISDESKVSALRHVMLRYFNVAGADEQHRVGESHDPETHLIPLLLRAMQNGRPVTVYGTDYDTHDGTCVRDYVHVSDLVDAHLLALWALMDGMKLTRFNVGSSTGHSVREVIDTVSSVTGYKAKAIDAPRRGSGDASRLVANCDKIKDALGWDPKRDLECCVKSAWEWERHRTY